MTKTRVAFITNLCPYYRRPLYELLAEELDTRFYFFSDGREKYLSSAMEHEPGDLPVRDVRCISIAGNPVLIGLEQELRSDRYDVVVKCLNGRLMVPYTYLLARRRNLPFVLWTGMWHHPHTVAHRLTRPLTHSIYRGADAIVTYGEHVRRFVESAPGVSAGKTYVAGQAINTAPFAAVEPRFADPAEIFFAGQLEEHKGVDDLLIAFATITDPHVRLRVAGNGSLDGRVRAGARLDARIDVLGHVGQADMPAELARARCLVLPAITTRKFREAWGLVINEAMAAGVPVIVTTAVGAAAGGLVVDGRNGIVVPEGRPDALADAMRRMAEGPELARSMGDRARADVVQFSYERMADAFGAAIEHAIEARGARRTLARRFGSRRPQRQDERL